MGLNAPVIFTPGSLPAGFCHTSWQTTFNAFVSVLSGYLPGIFSSFNFGSTVPAVEDQDKPWLQTNADGITPIGWKVYLGGKWVNAQPHPLRPGMIVPYYGDVGNVPMLDNYDADLANPFWRVCDGTLATPDLRGRTIIGMGLGAGLTDRAFGDTGGVETVTLTEDQIALPIHTHDLTVDTGTAVDAGMAGTLAVDGGRETYWDGTEVNTHIATTRSTDAVLPADVDPHENMPPFYAMALIMRTNREY